ncbi:MAG: fasciclin domain-containing protein [Saprospiraceae bacterium]|nr:fasciclin domain-containing protein [Saprospiraceae bacterium]
MKKLFFGMFIALSASLLFTACGEDEEETPKNIVQLAQSNSELSSLVAALTRAGLVDALNADGPFTVFAPTNAAFNEFLSANGFASLEAVPVDVLKQVLLNHVVSGEVRAANVPTEGYVKTLATYGTSSSNLSLLAQNNASGVSLNKDTKVTTADVIATNGVIHIVNKVIGLPSIVSHALNNPNFSTLVAALTRPSLGVDYVGLLSGAGPFTVFAPTNAAFTALLTELNLTSLDQVDDATLNAVLQYHVVANANVLAGQLTQGQVVTTYQTGTFTIDLNGGAKITDARGRVSNIILTDVQAANGVVHAIDKVILP